MTPLNVQHPDGMEGNNEGRLRGVQVRHLELPVLACRQLHWRLPAERRPPLSIHAATGHSPLRLDPAGQPPAAGDSCSHRTASMCSGVDAL
jgi:hypothetical protein